ncbi:MAG: hypothetical protein HFF50_04100 [Lawsonibacter sp.]|nr:hypothetical protein [Lawsonibacter sp.]
MSWLKQTGKRAAAWLLTAALAVLLVLPQPAAAADIYFTAIKDHVARLTADTMPLWSGGTLYVPYTTFDRTTNGGYELVEGLVCSYTHSGSGRTGSTVTLYTTSQFLTFDLTTGTCRNDITQEVLTGRAIIRNGRPYLPLGTVCSFFGLEYTYTPVSYISQGYLVRIKNGTEGMDDTKFLEAAYNLMNLRLREYSQSLDPVQEPVGTDDPSSTLPAEDETNVSTYLAIRCAGGEGLESVLNTLEEDGSRALFFLTPQALEDEPGLVCRILGTGHSLGIWAEGADAAQTRALLDRGSRVLEGLTHTRTTLALVPQEQAGQMEEGWVCWQETLSLAPGDTVGGAAFASSTLRRLAGRTRSTCLTLEGGDNAARVLPILLRQLRSARFVVSVPLETRLA